MQYKYHIQHTISNLQNTKYKIQSTKYNMQYTLYNMQYNVFSLQHSHHTTYTTWLTCGRSITARPWRWLRRFCKPALTVTHHDKYNMFYMLWAESVVYNATSRSRWKRWQVHSSKVLCTQIYNMQYKMILFMLLKSTQEQVEQFHLLAKLKIYLMLNMQLKLQQVKKLMI